MPNEATATLNPFWPHDIIGVIYGFLRVSEVLKLRRISRKLNEAAVQNQEDIVDEHRSGTAVNILLTRSTIILSSAWIIDLPRPSILAFFIKNAHFRKHLPTRRLRSLTASSEIRHLLVVIDTLQTPEQREQYFQLIAENHLSATEFCKRSILSIDEQLKLVQTINFLYKTLLPSCDHAGIIKDREALFKLITTHYESTSDETQQKRSKKAIQKKINNLLLISEYKKSKFNKSKILRGILISVAIVLTLGFLVAIAFATNLIPLMLSTVSTTWMIVLASIPLSIALIIVSAGCFLATGILISYLIERYDNTQKSNPFYHVTGTDLASRYRKAEPHLKALNTQVSQMGMFKTKETLPEDVLRQELSLKLTQPTPDVSTTDASPANTGQLNPSP